MASSFLALLSLASVAVSPQAKLDIDFPGGRLEVLANSIAQQLGKQVSISPEVRNEIVVAYGQQVDAEQMMGKVAALTATTWTISGDQLNITPDGNLRNRQKQEAAAKLRENLRKGIETFKKQMQPQDYPPDEEGGEPYHWEPAASERLLLQIVTGLGENSLAQVGKGQRIVFSSSPNRMQRPLGRFDSRLVDEWVKDYNTAVDENLAYQRESGEYSDYQAKRIDQPPAKLLVAVSRFDSYASYLSITMLLIGQDGSVLANQMGYISGDLDEEPMYREEEGSQEEPAQPGDEIPVEWSPEAQKLAKATPYSGELPQPIAAEILDMIRRPDEFEPLRYSFGEGLVSAAKKMGKPLVAVPSDAIMGYGMELPKNYGELRNLFGYYGVKAEEANGWMLLKPQNPDEARRERVNRFELAKLLSLTKDRVFVPLDALAEYVYRNPSAFENSISMTRLTLFAPMMLGGGFGGGASPEMLSLYGSLSPGMRQMVRTGRPLAYSQLSADSRLLVDKMVFGAVPQIRTIDVQASLNEPSMSQLFNFSDEGGYGAIANEPTELLANGIAPQSPIHSNAVKGLYAVPMDDEGRLHTMSFPLGKEELAYFQLLMKQPEYAAEMTNYLSMLNGLRIGEKETFYVVIQLTQKQGLTGALVDMKDPNKAQKYGLNSLPEDLKRQVDALAAELAKSEYGQMLSGGFGGGTIKP